MREYTSYKSSGSDWTGNIPVNWDVEKIKFHVSFKKGSNPKILVDEKEDGLPEYLSVENLRGKQKTIQFVKDWIDSVEVTEEDTLLLWDGANAGEFMKGKSGILSSTMAKLDYHKAIQPNFGWYLFLAYEKEIRELTTGMGIPHVNGYDLRNAYVPIPSPNEQTQIVKYLDYKTGLIDNFIASRKKQIDLLREQLRKKMFTVLTMGLNNKAFKPTELPWFSEIPATWEMYKFNAAIKLLHGFQFRDNHFREQGVKVVKITQLKADGTLDLSEASLVDEAFLTSLKKKIIKNGDILMALTGGTIGKIIRVEDLEEEVLQNYRVGKFIPKDNRVLDKDYMFWVLSSEFTYAQILFLQRETGQPNIGIGDFSKMFFPMPNTLEEQREIVEYIVEQKTETDSLISKYQKQIELMQEYRTAIISQAVTGKIDVREWQPKAKEINEA
jgi:type I restriction enzyme S subunit